MKIHHLITSVLFACISVGASACVAESPEPEGSSATIDVVCAGGETTCSGSIDACAAACVDKTSSSFTPTIKATGPGYNTLGSPVTVKCEGATCTGEPADCAAFCKAMADSPTP